MKRVIKNHITVRYEFNIDIVSSSYSEILSATSQDLTGTEYESFITSMISQFKLSGYSMSYEDDYTHSSNVPGSMSEYFTFTKWIDDVQIIVVTNVRISDHPDVPRGRLSAQEKRANYVARVGQEMSKDKDPSYVATYPLDITFDDKHFKSFSSEQFYLHSQLNKIDGEVQEIIDESN